jgi:hypothetical protein
VADSKAGATTRDLITDFDHLVDKLDLMGLDVDPGAGLMHLISHLKAVLKRGTSAYREG